MGIFSKKEICCICGNEKGKQKIIDGWVCKDCLKLCRGFYPLDKPFKSLSSLDIKNYIERSNNNKILLEQFQTTKKVGNYIEFDENNRQWLIPDGFNGKKVNPKIYRFDDIVGFELLEDGDSVTKGGLGRALVGGALLGGVGAIVGGVTGKKKTKSVVNSLKVKITVNDTSNPTVYVNLLNSKTKTNSFVYKVSYSSAQEILSMLSVITENQNEKENKENTTSVADELMKLKRLLDEGILTEEEFNTQKSKILNQ